MMHLSTVEYKKKFNDLKLHIKVKRRAINPIRSVLSDLILPCSQKLNEGIERYLATYIKVVITKYSIFEYSFIA